MANLFYSEAESITNSISANVADASRFLNYARTDCNIQLPQGLSCSAFLKNLPSSIDNYIDEINDIYDAVSKIDDSFHNLSDAMKADNHKIDVSTIISKRDRLIK